MSKLALTGGLSSGKTTVSRFFQELGAYIVNADDIVHKLFSLENECGRQIIQLLGNDIIAGDRIDRSKVAKKVFNNPRKLKALEQILHPKVLEEIEKEFQKKHLKNEKSLFVAELPLLFEIGAQNFYDKVITVIANPALCAERFTKDTGYGYEEYASRMARQMNPYEKALKSDFVIYNQGSLAELRQQVEQIYKELTEESCF